MMQKVLMLVGGSSEVIVVHRKEGPTTSFIMRPLKTPGWKLAPARQTMPGKFDVEQVEILSGLVKFPFTLIQILGEQIMGFLSCWAGRQKS